MGIALPIIGLAAHCPEILWGGIACFGGGLTYFGITYINKRVSATPNRSENDHYINHVDTGVAVKAITEQEPSNQPSIQSGQIRCEQLIKNIELNKPIICGHGVYALGVTQGETIQPLDPKLFEEAFPILQQHYEDCAKGEIRPDETTYGNLLKKIQAIDESIQFFFFPRTTSEMIYLKMVIEEYLSSGEEYKLAQAAVNFWNECLIKALPDGCKEHLSLQEHKEIFKKIYIFFREIDFDSKSQSTQHIIVSWEKFKKRSRSSRNIPAAKLLHSFLLNMDHSEKMMGIRDDNVRILYKSLALECSKHAQTHLFLYRAGRLEQDKLIKDKKPFSLSLGTSWFAGSMFDRGACSWHYVHPIRNPRDAFIIPVPREEISKSIFHYPASGDSFHVRTKIGQSEITEFKGWLGCDSANNIDDERAKHLNPSSETFLEEIEKLVHIRHYILILQNYFTGSKNLRR